MREKFGMRKMGNRWAAGIVVGIVLSGCGVKKSLTRSFEGIACGAADQHQSYMNPIDSNVTQTVTVDGAFTASERSKIESALDTWNRESRRTLGRDLFKVVYSAVSAQAVPSSKDNCGFPGSSSGFSIIRVSSADTWTSLGFTASNPGVTIRCSEGANYAAKQVVLINPKNMENFVYIFENVVLHELGHSVGLGHSCDDRNAGLPGFVGCNSKSLDPAYEEAVMLPWVSNVLGEQKEDLRRNDEERAYCALNYRP